MLHPRDLQVKPLVYDLFAGCHGSAITNIL